MKDEAPGERLRSCDAVEKLQRGFEIRPEAARDRADDGQNSADEFERCAAAEKRKGKYTACSSGQIDAAGHVTGKSHKSIRHRGR